MFSISFVTNFTVKTDYLKKIVETIPIFPLVRFMKGILAIVLTKHINTKERWSHKFIETLS